MVPPIPQLGTCHPCHHPTVGLCSMRLQYLSGDIRVLGLAFRALFKFCSDLPLFPYIFRPPTQAGLCCLH